MGATAMGGAGEAARWGQVPAWARRPTWTRAPRATTAPGPWVTICYWVPKLAANAKPASLTLPNIG